MSLMIEGGPFVESGLELEEKVAGEELGEHA